MGHPVPADEPKYGDDCLECYAVDETPFHMKVVFTGVLDCDPDWPPGHGDIPTDITLEQSELFPCYYFWGDVNDWNAGLWLDDEGDSLLWLQWRNITYFVHLISDETCQMDFTNQSTCNWVTDYGHEGTAAVTPVL